MNRRVFLRLIAATALACLGPLPKLVEEAVPEEWYPFSRELMLRGIPIDQVIMDNAGWKLAYDMERRIIGEEYYR